MKVVVINVLRKIRKVNFILALSLLVAPLVSPLGVSAKSSVEEVNIDESLQEKYDKHKKFTDEIDKFERELSEYLHIDDKGIAELVIPSDIILDISFENLELIKRNIELINSQVENGNLIVLGPNEIYMTSEYEQYKSQSLFLVNLIITYYSIKVSVSVIGGEFLTSKGYDSTAILFNHALWAGGDDLSWTDNYKITMITREDEDMQNAVIAKFDENPDSSFSHTFSSGDLYYSFRTATLTYEQSYSSYYGYIYPNGIAVKLSDRFDFGEWQYIKALFNGEPSLGTLANDFGTILEIIGMVNAFDIELLQYTVHDN